MLTFIKLGGSLITDKRHANTFRESVVVRLANEIRAALDDTPDLRLLIGHGSGSFGHVPASRHHTIDGVHTSDQWRGFAEVATAAAELNALVAQTLHKAGIPIWRIQPSASAISHDGVLASLALHPIESALEHRLVPLVYGDVALDEIRGGTILSTESLFFFLAHRLPVERILLLGEVEGVCDSGGKLVEEITHDTVDGLGGALGKSAGIDVTGGMATKVHDMLTLIQALPHLTIRIMDGRQPELLRQTLLGQASPGTRISR